MQKLIAVMLLSLCAIHNAHGAEISYKTKNYPETRPLIPKDNCSNASFVRRVALLPLDVQRNVLRKFFSDTREDSERNKDRFLLLDPRLVLKQYFRAHEMCPLTIGNKTFGWKSLIRLTKKQQEDLFSIGTRGICYSCITGYDNTKFGKEGCDLLGGNYASRFELLAEQPDHIKKGLVIEIDKNTICGESACVAYCGSSGVSTGVSLSLKIAQICWPHACGGAAVAEIACNIFAGVYAGLYLTGRFLTCAKCFDNIYEFDKEKHS
jgi:hypothetical protein